MVTPRSGQMHRLPYETLRKNANVAEIGAECVCQALGERTEQIEWLMPHVRIPVHGSF